MDIRETANTLKTKVKEVNKDFLKVSNEIVEETLATGEQWQEVFAKAMQTTTKVVDQNQKLALKTVAGAREQYVNGSRRLMNLLGIDAAKVSQQVKETVEEAKEKVEDATANARKTANKVINKTAATAKKVNKSTAKARKETNKKIEKTATEAKKQVAKATAKVKAETNKAIDETAQAVKPTVQRDNLKLINGVGPKMEETLNQFGIDTFAQMAAANVKNLTAALETVNPRYASTERVEDWIAAAKKMLK
ncbi:MAG: DUF4332 domain-containing protein [Bacteroidota bacterium]